ncbi:unnamed protein product [Plutella xylostella]|uniref:Protein Wnt n=1 Tax=Plutella xylostella TaxID=51655 RepID=A0A8S4E170_PLUXY|nr:unnamed protein product [Plutella xylostella]
MGALHESEGNWTEADCVEARRGGALWSGQARACRRQPAAMPHVAAAARLARQACLAAHAGERWNCTSVEQAPKFTPDLLTGRRCRRLNVDCEIRRHCLRSPLLRPSAHFTKLIDTERSRLQTKPYGILRLLLVS